ncbi:Polyprenol reductase, partial [Pseudocercospora fuligena]
LQRESQDETAEEGCRSQVGLHERDSSQRAGKSSAVDGNKRYHTTGFVTMDAVTLLRAIYLAAAAAVFVVFALPPLRSRFLDYGARSSKQQKEKGRQQQNVLSTLLDHAASITVPHSWFASFYAVSVSCSLYWLSEWVFGGPAFRTIVSWTSSKPPSMTVSQVQVAWLAMFAQGSRRLYESIALARPSQSRMWVGHWALGILFYICTSIAVWVEGGSVIRDHDFSVNDLTFVGLTLRTFLGTTIFILASGLQHDCHSYLAALKASKKGEKAAPGSQYRLPDHPAWNLSLTPHYFAECLIYLSLAVIAAPRGSVLNWTFVSALTFVAINLGVTAYGTKEWYKQKFGDQAVYRRARMIPFIY